MEYTYSASGEKLEKLRKSSLTNTYIGNFVYKVDGSIDYIITPEGRLVNVSGNLVYEYYLKDHLGNTRNTFQIVSNTVVQKQKMDYYPFGMQLDKAFVSHDNKYLYNGKELQDDQFDNGMKLDWLDYGARMYDAQIGRWHCLDPLAFKYTALSPYCYVGNRPTVAIDPNGKEIVVVGKNKAQTYDDLAIIYATPMGKQIIDALHNSNTTYKINGGGWRPTSSGYSPFWNKTTYYQKDATVKGNKFRSFEMLGHELYHAFQDESGDIEGRSLFSVEKEAVQFENYLRKIYSDGAGSQRLEYGSAKLFEILEPTSFNTNGEKRDVNSVRTYVETGKSDLDGKGEDGTVKQDNTRVQVNAQFFQRILEYMDDNELQRVTVNF